MAPKAQGLLRCMALAAQSPMPMGSRMPVAKAPVRYAHVAHFVGLSLLKDPNLARPKVVKSASLPRVRTAESDERPETSGSLPSLSVERVDQLRNQINWLKAERRAESEQLKKLEHSLSDCVIAEKRAHERVQKQKQRRDKHVDHIKNVETKMMEIKDEVHERQLGSTWPGADQQAGKGEPSPFSAARDDGIPKSPGSPGKAEDALRNMPQDVGRSATAPSGIALGLAETDGHQSSDLLQKGVSMKLKEPTNISIEMFDNEYELAQYRRAAVRKDLMSKAERRADPTGQLLGGRPVTFFEMKLGLIDFRLPNDQLQACWQGLETVEATNVLETFKLLNLSGSGRICANDFADGIARLGVPWQKLTGLKKNKDLFRLFDCDKDGVITLFELFPRELHAKKACTGTTTPDFWKTWVKGNPPEEFLLECPKGRHPPWNTGVADDGLVIRNERDSKDAEAAFMRKWMQTTMRRMKGRGKSDARCREMCCLHLPRGTGPEDRTGVPTFSETEVKQCRREYSDAVMEPQRTVLKDLFELREIRKELSTSRHKLWTVAMEPYIRQQALEEQKTVAKSALGGLNLHIHDKTNDPVPPKDEKQSVATVDQGLSAGLHDLAHFGH